METKKMNKKKMIFILAFVFLHILSSYLITADFVFPDINPYPRTFLCSLTVFLGISGLLSCFWDWQSLFSKPIIKEQSF